MKNKTQNKRTEEEEERRVCVFFSLSILIPYLYIIACVIVLYGLRRWLNRLCTRVLIYYRLYQSFGRSKDLLMRCTTRDLSSAHVNVNIYIGIYIHISNWKWNDRRWLWRNDDGCMHWSTRECELKVYIYIYFRHGLCNWIEKLWTIWSPSKRSKDWFCYAISFQSRSII